jgi:drug/metabolite transporter (DMT)-like permease
LLSAGLLGERLSLPKLLAAGIALSGVALMVRGSAARPRRPSADTSAKSEPLVWRSADRGLGGRE